MAAGEAASFAELDARAEAIADRLIEAGVQPDTLVGVLADRSVGMLASILGVLKAQGIPPRWVKIELTETILASDAAVTSR